MQLDFHYYAAYCAAFLAGYTHEECLAICYSDQFTDVCSRTFLERIKGPAAAATTQLQGELADARQDLTGLQDITRIWASFHFLPFDLYADPKRGGKRYRSKYRLICNSNGSLVADTVELAKGKDLQAAGLAMHVISDTWAHKYFAGTPSLVINNTDYYFYELLPEGDSFTQRRISFIHSTSRPDDLEQGIYSNSLHRSSENSIMNLGHGRAGHLPDYSFARYKYLPAWMDYEEVVKDNPSDYYCAFGQVVYALQYLRGQRETFETDRYASEILAPYEARIREILEKRQPDSSEDWKAFGEELSGCEIEPFDPEKYMQEYIDEKRGNKSSTFLGRFIMAALSQKSMVTNRIFSSGNKLAGYSVEYSKKGFRGNRDFRRLLKQKKKEEAHE